MKLNAPSLVIMMSLLLLSCASSSQKGVKTTSSPLPSEIGIRTDAFFKVTGIERFWTLEIYADRIKFISLNAGETFETPYTMPVISGNSMIYKSKSASKEIEIVITDGKCDDGALDTPYNKIVKVNLKTVGSEQVAILKGCGNYIQDARLNFVWVLQEMKGKKVTPEDFGKELPYIDIHTTETAFTGFGGCNRLKGKIEAAEANKLRFTEIVSTKMACISGNKENLFMEVLQNATKYEVRDKKLYLSNQQGIVAVFTKGT